MAAAATAACAAGQVGGGWEGLHCSCPSELAALHSPPTLRRVQSLPPIPARLFTCAGMLRRLRSQRLLFRTFSSGGGGSGGSSGGGGGGGGGGGSSGSGGFGLWGAYLALLSKRPLATKAVTAALLNGLGDVIAQRQFEQGKDFDWKRCSIFTLLVRCCCLSPLLSVAYSCPTCCGRSSACCLVSWKLDAVAWVPRSRGKRCHLASPLAADHCLMQRLLSRPLPVACVVSHLAHRHPTWVTATPPTQLAAPCAEPAADGTHAALSAGVSCGTSLMCCRHACLSLLCRPLCLQGLLLIGPTLHFWYGSLGTIVKATGNTGAIMRLSLDQLCFAPVFISSEPCVRALHATQRWAG